MENHHSQWVNHGYMAIFHSYVKLPEGKQLKLQEHAFRTHMEDIMAV